MDTTKFDKNLAGEVSDWGEAIELIVENYLEDTNVMEIGIIQEYDAGTNTATIKIATNRKMSYWADGGGMIEVEVESPTLTGVPIVFPQGGGFSLTFPIVKGDECIMHFANRPFWKWYTDGVPSLRSQFRSHDIKDCVAIVGINSKPKTISNIDTEGVELRNSDASIKLNLSDSGISVVGDLDVDGGISCTGDVTAQGDVVAGGISLQNHTHNFIDADGVQKVTQGPN